MSERAFDAYRETPLWAGIESIVKELVATNEISVNTAPDYVIGFFCRELAAKKLTGSVALER